ncbi:hypothetical protein N579_01255 [Corynebacterium pseudodiphtheriticum 090104]|nr:hypothetical protein N579_01255 [Corynebacterium pseudodiphtheriticum 090104]
MNVEMIQEQLNNAVTFFKAFENITKGLEFFYVPQTNKAGDTIEGTGQGLSSAFTHAFKPLSSEAAK